MPGRGLRGVRVPQQPDQYPRGQSGVQGGLVAYVRVGVVEQPYR